MEHIETGVILKIDITPLKEKINQLIAAPGSSSLESIQEQLSGGVTGLLDDIIFGELSTTVTANGVVEFVQRVDFGSGFENTFAALRA
ncbi:hypothetical protein ACLEYI_06130 [Enterobacter ludwigii]|uniref:hypothetical protein n=1 Tax=Enterobacter ludwigii TaxID=299767 RepID=UPI003976292C